MFAMDTRNLPLRSAAEQYLLKHQLSGGGWGPYSNAPAEIFDTALAVLALACANSENPALARARAYLEAEQKADGSWSATTRPTGGESYAQQISTTAWAALALIQSNQPRQ
jgi:hypothetical protein